MIRLLRDIGYFIILCLMIIGVGGVLYHAIGRDGWIEGFVSGVLSQGISTALVVLIGVVFIGWLIRRWLIATQRNALFNDFLMYGMVALGLFFVASVATWLARRYRVAVEPVSRLVQEAWDSGQRAGVDPTLVLAIIAIESSFNPFAQSSMGAQGLMQVMTRIHDEKYERFGGSRAAFDPVSNLRVGVQVLKECISRAGSLEGGLKYYVGAANFADDGGYAGKVLAEQTNLRRVADGKWVSVYVTLPSTTNPTPLDAKNVSPEPGPGAEAPKSSDTDKVAWVRSTR